MSLLAAIEKKCKEFKDLFHVFVICFIICTDQFLMTFKTFYRNKS